MPFKNKNNKYWKVRLKRLPKYGDSPLLSTRSTSRRTAEQMEASLRQVYEMGCMDNKYFRLIDALKPSSPGKVGRITLTDLHYAVRHHEIDDLLISLTSPTLADAIEEFLTYSGEDSKATRDGMNKLLSLAPRRTGGAVVHASYLKNPKNILRMARELEDGGIKKSTVYRNFLAPVSRLLRYTFGNAERDKIFSEISYRVPKPQPRPLMDAALIAQFLSACDKFVKWSSSEHVGELPLIAKLSLLTSADLSVVLRLTPADIQIIHDQNSSYVQVHLRGTKRVTRNRTVLVSGAVIPALVQLMDGKAAHEKLFSLTSGRASSLWVDMRERYGLPYFRFKDLRHAFAKHAVLSGMDQSVSQSAMGHSNEQMTRHYGSLISRMKPGDAEKIARSMGLSAAPGQLKKITKPG